MGGTLVSSISFVHEWNIVKFSHWGSFLETFSEKNCLHRGLQRCDEVMQHIPLLFTFAVSLQNVKVGVTSRWSGSDLSV